MQSIGCEQQDGNGQQPQDIRLGVASADQQQPGSRLPSSSWVFFAVCNALLTAPRIRSSSISASPLPRTISGLIALTYSFLAMQYLVLRMLYPQAH